MSTSNKDKEAAVDAAEEAQPVSPTPEEVNAEGDQSTDAPAQAKEAPEVSEDEKIYSAREMAVKVAEKIAAYKREAIERGVEEKMEAYTTIVNETKDKLSQAERENQALKLSMSSGVSPEVLLKTGLSGEALEDFVAELKSTFTEHEARIKSGAAYAVNAAAAAEDPDAWRKSFLAQWNKG